MAEEEGARAQRKRRTRQTITEIATELFLAHGFDQVSVADIAAQAHVSKMTVFNYFDTKEDIVLSQIADHADDFARLVRTRTSGMSPLTAIRNGFIAQIQRHDPISGLCFDPYVVAFRALIMQTRSLLTRLIEQTVRAEAELAAALQELLDVEDISAVIVAGQLIGTQRNLAQVNFERVQAGGDPDELTRRAVEEAERSFDLLADGLASSPFGRPRST